MSLYTIVYINVDLCLLALSWQLLSLVLDSLKFLDSQILILKTQRERERAAKLNSLKFSLRLTNSLFEDTERQRKKREERRDRAVVVWRPNKFSPRNSLQLQSAADTSKCLAAGEEENSFPIAHTWVQWVGEVKSFSIAHGWGVWQTPANSVHNWGLRRQTLEIDFHQVVNFCSIEILEEA